MYGCCRSKVRSSFAIHATPLIVADELVCISTDEGYGKNMIFAVNLKDGVEVWKIKIPNLRSNLVCIGTTIYCVDAKYGFHRIDLATGATIQSVKLFKDRPVTNNAPDTYLVSDGEILLVTYQYHLFASDALGF